MKTLNSTTRKKLRGLAHSFDPVIYIGQKGLTEELVLATDDALNTHELIKVKFNDHKKDKKTLSEDLAQKIQGHIVGMVGNVVVLYREHPDEKKRKIEV